MLQICALSPFEEARWRHLPGRRWASLLVAEAAQVFRLFSTVSTASRLEAEEIGEAEKVGRASRYRDDAKHQIHFSEADPPIEPDGLRRTESLKGAKRASRHAESAKGAGGVLGARADEPEVASCCSLHDAPGPDELGRQDAGPLVVSSLRRAIQYRFGC